jgi:hypothetical protein
LSYRSSHRIRRVEPNALAEIAEKLSQAKINKYTYATATGGSAKAIMILAVPDVAKALSILGG